MQYFLLMLMLIKKGIFSLEVAQKVLLACSCILNNHTMSELDWLIINHKMQLSVFSLLFFPPYQLNLNLAKTFETDMSG